MRSLWIWLALILPMSGHGQDCKSVIELSKVVTTVVEKREFVEQHAANFCSSYGQSVANAASASFGASYEFLSSSLSGGRSSAEVIAGKYCSAANSNAANDDAYRQYIETISPNAFAAYEQCLRMSKQDLKFNINVGSILPSEFSMSASFVSSTGQVSAKVTYSSSSDVRCSWDGTEGRTREILSGSSAILECVRPDPTIRSFVTLVRSDIGSGQEPLTLPWQAYDRGGVALDSLAAVSRRLSTLESQLSAIDADHNRLHFQSGTLIMRAVGTPEITDSSVCPQDRESFRGDLDGRVTFPVPFTSVPTVAIGLSSIDIRGRDSMDSNRLNLSVTDVDQKGFNYSFSTWCTTVVYGASASWFAIAK